MGLDIKYPPTSSSGGFQRWIMPPLLNSLAATNSVGANYQAFGTYIEITKACKADSLRAKTGSTYAGQAIAMLFGPFTTKDLIFQSPLAAVSAAISSPGTSTAYDFPFAGESLPVGQYGIGIMYTTSTDTFYGGTLPQIPTNGFVWTFNGGGLTAPSTFPSFSLGTLVPVMELAVKP